MSKQKRVDHIIIGLGLSGAAMALQLIRRGKRIAVFDHPGNNRSSSVAAGLFNPVSGKMMTKAWRAEDLFPYLTEFYQEAERMTSQAFFHPCPLYIPFRSSKEQNDWTLNEGMKPYIERIFTSTAFGDQAADELGGILLRRCGYVHVASYVQAVRDLIERDSGTGGQLDYDKLLVDKNYVQYGDVRAGSLILCDGLHARSNPLTSWLHLQPLKGETIDVHFSQELKAIYNRGVYAVPLGNGNYRVGATFERSEAEGTTAAGREQLEAKLRTLVKIPYEVRGQNWGLRPTTRDRRPIIGQHPQHANIFILNGMGTKGVSQAPYFSRVLADAITKGGQITQDVNISRFYPLSSKSRD